MVLFIFLRKVILGLIALVVRFCLKHFRDVNIFSVSNFAILYIIILNYLLYAT